MSRINVSGSKEIWVKSQTLNGVVSTQMTHLLGQQQPEDDKGIQTWRQVVR